ncbi:PUA-like domain-containing protein [Rhodocollybia butyracea]|uniref:PUA-like domain-containing protein n=1 Tax=Rhodocollybia butyracea TaxID=206335 RepID=A0A9P5UGD6_9AGAR|nr:PUA-like domain-containing protein [Rhodocollybia butyracea]
MYLNRRLKLPIKFSPLRAVFSHHNSSRLFESTGQYEDKDKGDVIIYTGTGGQEDSFAKPGPQVEDQTFDHPLNASLYISYERGIPIRVIRGHSDSVYAAPEKGTYRYDGMYKVTKAYMDKSANGYAVCRFHLERVSGQPPIPRRDL